jgi:hypothetical protein
MTLLRRGVLVLAGLALIASFVLGLVPAYARPVVTTPPPGVDTVNCGTVFASTRWSNEDGCEGPRLERAGYTVGALLLGFVSGAVGLGLYLVEARSPGHMATGRRKR